MNDFSPELLDKYEAMIELQERTRIVDFINSVIKDLALFNDEAGDLKAIVNILESEDWALGY